jgi:hypothetical protein
MMKGMPAIPESTCSSITLRLLDHAARQWPQIKNLHVRCSRGFAYVTAVLPGDDEPRPLFRLRYGGSAHSFGFAYYSWAAGRYEDSVLITGSPAGTPQQALDTVATFHVSDTDNEPPTNLQTQPLREAQSPPAGVPGGVLRAAASAEPRPRVPGSGALRC